jgi:hypothetical protein
MGSDHAEAGEGVASTTAGTLRRSALTATPHADLPQSAFSLTKRPLRRWVGLDNGRH